MNGKVEFMKDPVKKYQFKKASNNVAHIICLMSAVERLTAKCDSLDIYTDSEWIRYRMEELGEMSRRDWKDSRGREYSGADYWQRINTVLKKYNLNPVIHVKEHHSFKKWFIEQEKLNG